MDFLTNLGAKLDEENLQTLITDS